MCFFWKISELDLEISECFWLIFDFSKMENFCHKYPTFLNEGISFFSSRKYVRLTLTFLDDFLSQVFDFSKI